MRYHRIRLVTSAGLALLVSACATVDPYTGETYVDPAATGLLLGGLALTGAAVYAASHDHDRRHYYRGRGRDHYGYRNRYHGRHRHDGDRHRHYRNSHRRVSPYDGDPHYRRYRDYGYRERPYHEDLGGSYEPERYRRFYRRYQRHH